MLDSEQSFLPLVTAAAGTISTRALLFLNRSDLLNKVWTGDMALSQSSGASLDLSLTHSQGDVESGNIRTRASLAGKKKIILTRSDVSFSRRHDRFWRRILWCGLPGNWWGHVLPIDHTALWRRHLVWAKLDGRHLLETVTARYSSTTVLLTLLVGTGIGTLFSPSQVMERVRSAMDGNDYGSIEFWTGIMLFVSIFLSIGALIATLTAWSIFTVVSRENSATILRSSIGLYTAQLPSGYVLLSLYSFVVWVSMFLWILLPLYFAVAFTLGAVLQISHISSTYSAMGEVIMATSAMSHERIIPKDEEEEMTPKELSQILYKQMRLARRAGIPITRQYRMDYHGHLRSTDLEANHEQKIDTHEKQQSRTGL